MHDLEKSDFAVVAVKSLAALMPIWFRCRTSVVFTLPAALADIASEQSRDLHILFTASQTMPTIAADPKHLGAHIGFTSVLHTWGSALTHHPHVHMIVPGGGISLDGTRWVPCRPNFLLPVRFSPACSAACSFPSSSPPTRPAASSSSPSTPTSLTSEPSRPISRRCVDRLVRLYQTAVRRTPSRARLSVALHPPSRLLHISVSSPPTHGGVTVAVERLWIEGPGRYQSIRMSPNEFIRDFSCT